MGKKATFVIDDTLLEEARNIVETKKLKSLNSFVEQTLRDGIERIRRQEIEEAIIEASQDPQFLSDIQSIGKDFEFSDFEW